MPVTAASPLRCGWSGRWEGFYVWLVFFAAPVFKHGAEFFKKVGQEKLVFFGVQERAGWFFHSQKGASLRSVLTQPDPNESIQKFGRFCFNPTGCRLTRPAGGT